MRVDVIVHLLCAMLLFRVRGRTTRACAVCIDLANVRHLLCVGTGFQGEQFEAVRIGQRAPAM